MATLQEILEALNAQAPQQAQSSSLPLIANILGAGLNVAGAVTGKGAVGSPLSQLAADIEQKERLRQAAERETASTRFQMAKAFTQEERSIKAEKRAERKAAISEGKEIQNQLRIQAFNEWLGSDAAREQLGDKTVESLQYTDPKIAMRTVADLQKDEIKSGRRDTAATKRLQERAEASKQLAIFKHQLQSLKPSITEKVGMGLKEHGDLNRALLDANLSETQIKNITDDSERLKSMGIDVPGFWARTFLGASPGVEKAVQAGEAAKFSREQQLQGLMQGSNQAQANPLQQQAIAILQRKGRPITAESVQLMMQLISQQSPQ